MFDGISYCGILSVIVYKKLHPTAIRHSSGLQVLYHCFSGAAGIEAGFPATSAQALERTCQPHSCYTGIITQNSGDYHNPGFANCCTPISHPDIAV